MQASRPNGSLVYLATLTLTIAALYFGKPVLVPLALATLLTFLLTPIVNSLVRRGIRPAIAVVIIVAVMSIVFAGAVWGFGSQLRALAYELPDYKQNVLEKIADLRGASKGGGLDRIRQTWGELKGELGRPAAASTNDVKHATSTSTNAPTPDREPVPVVVQGHGNSDLWSIPTALGPLLEVLATSSLVFVLVIFMLLRKRELRNRLILLFGYGQLPTTTRALDEAAERISRYLLMQTVLNSSFGFAVGVSLWLVGLPYALLWGLLAGILRFIPYVGAWLGAALPFLLSLAVFPGWLHAFLVLGLIAAFELINNLVMEPLLYGHSAGVSEVALLVAVAFWTWLWGPLGLALATPLTVCVAVVAKYVPGLALLRLLLGDEAIMEPPLEFYQRLLAMDDVESTEIAQTYRKSHELIEVYDHLFLPALVSARRDYQSEKLSADHLDFIINTTGQLITKLGHNERSRITHEEKREPQEVFGIPVEDTMDELAMAMLGHVLPSYVTLRTVSAHALSGEVLEKLAEHRPPVICVGALAPAAIKTTRYLVKRIQTGFPNTPVVVARWGLQNEKRERELALAFNTEAISTSLCGARNYVMQMLQLRPEPAPLEFPTPREVDVPAAAN